MDCKNQLAQWFLPNKQNKLKKKNTLRKTKKIQPWSFVTAGKNSDVLSLWKTKIRAKLGSKPLFTASGDFSQAKLPFGGFQRLQFDRFGLRKEGSYLAGNRWDPYPTIGGFGKKSSIQILPFEGDMFSRFLKGGSTKQSKNVLGLVLSCSFFFPRVGRVFMKPGFLEP